MNIIIPVVDDEKSKDILAKGFQNTIYACIYNSTNNTYKWLATKDISTITENLSLALKHYGIYTVITSHMPLLAFKLFKESGINIYKAKGKSVNENVTLFLKNELELFSNLSTSSALNCISSCGINSCSSNSSCK